jgi:hypothetical protein
MARTLLPLPLGVAAVTAAAVPATPPAQASPAPSSGPAASGTLITNSSPASLPWPGRPFAATSFWNAALPAHTPVARRSGAYVREVVRQVSDYGPWINTTSYGVPVYVVPRDEPTRRVKLDTWGPDLQAAFDDVPLPADARPAKGTDAQLTVWQPSTNTMWEFWKLRRTGNGWHARWGGEMNDVSGNPGYFTHSAQTSDWGATATGLPAGRAHHLRRPQARLHQPRARHRPGRDCPALLRVPGAAYRQNVHPASLRFRRHPLRLDPSLNIPPCTCRR